MIYTTKYRGRTQQIHRRYTILTQFMMFSTGLQFLEYGGVPEDKDVITVMIEVDQDLCGMMRVDIKEEIMSSLVTYGKGMKRVVNKRKIFYNE